MGGWNRVATGAESGRSARRLFNPGSLAFHQEKEFEKLAELHRGEAT